MNLWLILLPILAVTLLVAFLVTTQGCRHRPPRSAQEVTRDVSFRALFKPQPDHPYFDLVDVTTLTSRRKNQQETEARRALLCMEAAMLSYVTDESLVRKKLLQAGWTDINFFHNGGTHAFLAANPESALLVFRGTEINNREDLRTDINILLQPHDAAGWIHRGFEEAYRLVDEELQKSIVALRENYPDCKLTIAGHSLGAALAVLAGAKLPQTEAVYSFGAPRIGTRNFRNDYPVPVFRYVNNNDIVPLCLPPIFYRHVGETRFIDFTGKLQRDTTIRDRAESRFIGHVEHAKQVFDHWGKGDWDAIPNGNFSDHAPINYVTPLREILKQMQQKNEG